MQTPLSYYFRSGLYYLPQVFLIFYLIIKKRKLQFASQHDNNHNRLLFIFKFSPIFKLAHHRHNIGTVLLFPRKGIHAILGTSPSDEETEEMAGDGEAGEPETLMNHVFFVHQKSGCLVVLYATI